MILVVEWVWMPRAAPPTLSGGSVHDGVMTDTPSPFPPEIGDNGGVSEAPQQQTDTDGTPVTPVLTPAQSKRANQSLKGMVISVLLTVAVAVPVVALNPPSSSEQFKPDVNVSAVASQAGQAADFTPVSPAMPDGWYPNFARWTAGTADKIDYWDFGYVTNDNGFVEVRQTGDATPGWIAKMTEDATASGTVDVDGTTWKALAKDAQVTWVLEGKDSTILLSSDSGDDVLRQSARAVMKDQDSATQQ